MRRATILIVDDEEAIRTTLKGSLEDEGYQVFTAADGTEALDLVPKTNPDIVFLDIWLPGMDGIQILKILKEHYPDPEVIVMTGHGTVSTAVQATKLGAFEFVEKPLDFDNLQGLIVRILEQRGLEQEESEVSSVHQEEEIIGSSLVIGAVREAVGKYAHTGEGVLIVGENGTGKELVARMINQGSGRKRKPMVKVNCLAFADEAIEEELLGSSDPFAKGGGERPAPAIDRARGGTLLIDSIEEMPVEVQKALIKALRTPRRSLRGRVGAAGDVRIIAASAEDLEEAVRRGDFDRDLYEYFSGNIIRIPSLRERRGDIPALVRFFLKNFCAEYGRKSKEIEDEAMRPLLDFEWPGNVKELKNIVERLVITVPITKIAVGDIPPSIRGESIPRRPQVYEMYDSFKDANQAWKRNYFLYHLRKNGWDIGETARALKIGRRTIRSNIDKLGIDIKPAGTEGQRSQRTLRRSMVLYGQGLHSGLKGGLILSPLPPNSGIIFGNISTGATVPMHLDYVDSTGYATSLRQGDAVAKTIEHFLAVLHTYRISNLMVKINDEIPIMDGSALDFCRLIEDAGIDEQGIPEEAIVIDEAISIGKEGEKYIRIEPADKLTIDYTLSYPPPVGLQKLGFVLEDEEAFKKDIAPARTFGFLAEIEYLEKQGLASGGRLNNVILIDNEKIVNTQLRFPDEFVRHKILDIIGDFYLLGRPIQGHITAHMTGHTENNALMRRIRDRMEIY